FKDDDADFDHWGGAAEVGYGYDVAWKPRVFLGGFYYGGEDNRDLTFGEWLNPFDTPEASVNFNRLFSNQIYSGAVDLTKDLSNCWIGRAGVMAAASDKLSGLLMLSYFEALEAFDRPVAPLLTFWTTENDNDLGWETDLFLNYQYSEDLKFEIGWAHFFTGDGAAQGAYSRAEGLIFTGGTADDDADYIYVGSWLKF
ncbi:MAG: hypothetical protein QG656_2127, partial [Candidatus Hydrogenedentes bacterium]|nr:hypothetical protein [Candidatus Hydrogenedentota bacterium]